MNIEAVAKIRNDYTDKFAIPRQSGIADSIKSKIIFEDEFNSESAIRGIEGYSHLWLIWGFSENIREKHSLTVRPPRLGGNERIGVFATRSPFRPNNLGLSSVKLIGVEYVNKKPVLIVAGADMLDGTPIYDIKPYIPYSDCHSDATGGFTDEREFPTLKVNADEKILKSLSDEQRETLLTILSNDPRPAYHNDESRIYGFCFAHKEIKFKVKDDILTVVSIENE